MKSLAKNPPNGGIPAKDNNNILTDKANNGIDLTAYHLFSIS